MTRIIAGAIGSLQLKPAAKATRPTSDRVKESLFAKLDAMGAIEGARVLDLFAGTGALGLESISRGAISVDLVERDPQALNALKANVRACENALGKQGLPSAINVHGAEVAKFLELDGRTFDLVFLDPPYEFPVRAIADLIFRLELHLMSESLLVVERSARSQIQINPNFEELSNKTYGDTRILIYKYI